MSFLYACMWRCPPKFFVHLCMYMNVNQQSTMLESTQWRVKYIALFDLLIHASNSVHNHTKLHHCALLSHHETPWWKLFHCGDASSFLTMTAFSRQAFSLLHGVLFLGQQPQWTGQGRPQLMSSTAQVSSCFILVAHWGSSTSNCSVIINKMLSLVVCKLQRHPLARVKFPDAESMEYFARLIHKCRPEVDDVINFMDGLC